MRGRRLRRQDLIAKQGKKAAYVNIFVSSATFPGIIAFIIDTILPPARVDSIVNKLGDFDDELPSQNNSA